MPTSRGVLISVWCNGTALDEYATRTVDERTVSCFIAGQPEKDFEILLSNTLEAQDLSVDVTVDGISVGRYYLAPGQKMLPGIYISETLTKPFRFRNLVFNDDKSIHDPNSYTYENMGSVDFAVYRCSKTGPEQFRPSQEPEDSKTSRDGTPSLLTGEGVPCKAVQGVGGYIIDPKTKPYASILFRYRPLEILQVQGVVSAASPIVESPYGSDYSNSRPTTASSASTAVSLREQAISKKRSFDATAFDPNPRMAQKARDAHVADVHSRPGSGEFYRRPQGWNPSIPSFDVLGSGTAEELTLMKSQLRHATDQMNSAMRQMKSAMDMMNKSSRQIQFLQQRIDAIEMRRPPPLVLPPFPADPQAAALYTAEHEHQLTQEVGIYPPLLHDQQAWTQPHDFHGAPISPGSPWV